MASLTASSIVVGATSTCLAGLARRARFSARSGCGGGAAVAVARKDFTSVSVTAEVLLLDECPIFAQLLRLHPWHQLLTLCVSSTLLILCGG